ncbi:alpha-L-fucosidase [Paenarthrobacter nitroguajacolicus]|uniref:alpha-L-fucosidase n=1 Tax=Paenarthrobacter nitroguajacolicus TaxID=211146 RepID=UPI00211815EF|nr:alpha-L-fucosidase [Paenarthrobacter nitroguajacolicus]
MIFNMGQPTIRWVGNENGLASDPVDHVVDRTSDTQYTDSSSGLHAEQYLPPECDVSIRRGWFWHPDDEPKSVEHLLAIYYQSVGMGANLLLNLPPDTRGLIPSRIPRGSRSGRLNGIVVSPVLWKRRLKITTAERP